MKIWHQYPFVRLLVPLIAGIAVAIISGMPVIVPVWLFTGLIIMFIVIVFVKPLRVPYKFRWILGLFLNFSLFVTGYQLTFLNTPSFEKNNVSHFISGSNEFIVRIDEPVVEKANSFKIVAKVLAVKDTTGWKRAGGKVILYFEKDDKVRKIEYGDELIIDSRLQKVEPPHNPEEFNYAKYLNDKGIYNQGFVKSERWKVLSRNNGNPVKALGIGIRSKFMEILRRNNVSGKEFAVASAILLGYDDYLDAEQKQAFAGAGAMHILCVSGLHVGIIYLVLNFMLSFLNKKRSTRIIKVILLLFLIWFYALITGFSPSVSRAATMFSFIIAGTSMKQRPDIYNILAASAFVLLVINPYLMTEVGFQLSYIAVAGIVWIYRPVYILFIPDNGVLRFIWRITVVSFAATFITFPLSLFYFHRFPFLFLVTNLIAIPFATLIIYTGMLVLITSFVPVVSGFLGGVLSLLLKALNFSVEFIEGLPYSTYSGVFITTAELFLVFGLTISIAVILIKRRKFYVYVFLTFVLLLLSSFTFRKYENLKQRNIIVYDISKMTAIQFTDGKKALLVADSALLANERKLEYHTGNNLWRNGIRDLKKINFDTDYNGLKLLKDNNFMQFYDRKIFVIDDKTELFDSTDKIRVDYLIISHNAGITIEDVIKCVDFKKVIFDSSNSPWRVKKWKEECEEAGIDCHCVGENGAFMQMVCK